MRCYGRPLYYERPLYNKALGRVHEALKGDPMPLHKGAMIDP